MEILNRKVPCYIKLNKFKGAWHKYWFILAPFFKHTNEFRKWKFRLCYSICMANNDLRVFICDFIIVFSRYKVGFIERAIFFVCISYLMLFLWGFFYDSHSLFISKPLCKCFFHLFILHYCFPFLLFSIIRSQSIIFCYKDCIMTSCDFIINIVNMQNCVID